MATPIPDFAHGRPKPGRLWSFLTMVANFRFVGVHRLLRDLSILIRVGTKNKDLVARSGIGFNRHQALNNPRAIEAMNDCVMDAGVCVQLATINLKWLKCSHINNAIDRLKFWTEHPPYTWDDLVDRATALRDAIEIELTDYLFYQYPKDKGLKLQELELEWMHAANAFPEIKYDVASATDCYALGHGTASVFHSMRIVERGLRALANQRKIVLPKDKLIEWATWQDIIKALEKEYKYIGENQTAGAEKDNLLAFYSGALVELNSFKDEYRNLVMHVRKNYDDLQALRVLNNVRSFMERLAEYKSAEATMRIPEF